MAFPYSRIEGANGLVTIAAFDSEAVAVKTITSVHPSFDSIKELLDAGDPAVWELFDVATGVMRKFKKVTDRVYYDGSNILFDGDPVRSPLATQVQRMLETGSQDYEALAKFWEKLASNPDEHSREQAYDWLASHDFKITSDGDLVAYKGVFRTPDGYESTTASMVRGEPSAIVDGEAVPELSRVPQRLGSVVEMARSQVVHDPSQACSRGLHVGTFSYASDYGNVVVEVHVHPADFVSVPTDAHGEKVRVRKYKVIAERTADAGGREPVLAGESAWAGDVGYRV